MNVLSLFCIFGIGSCRAQKPDGIQHGNFTIQKTVHTEKASGRVQNKNYETRSYLIEYTVLYKGKKVKFPARLQTGSSYNFPWRVYILQDGPVPTLIAGSHNMFLLAEEEGKAKITQLNQHPSNFGSLQWLDNRNGQPGNEIQILDLQNDNYLDSAITLTGGRYLLINRFTLLDVKTLHFRFFNKNNIYEYLGWRILLDRAIGHEIAVGFSNTFNKIVFGALRLDEKIEGRYYSALAEFDYIADSVEIIPFTRTDLHLETLDNISSDWVATFFHWNDKGKLELRPNISPPAWKGNVNFEDKSFINYELYPVNESIVPVFQKFLKGKYDSGSSQNSQFSIIDETDKRSILLRYRIKIGDNVLQLVYDKMDLKLRFENHFNEPFSEESRKIIISSANGFNEELLQQGHNNHFGKYKGE